MNRSRQKLTFRKTVHSILSLLLIFNTVAFYPQKAEAVTSNSNVIITNIYEGFRRVEKKIEINDTNIADYNNKKLNVRTPSGWQTITNAKTIGKNIIEANLNTAWDVEQALVEGTINQGNPPIPVKHETSYTGINEAGMPEFKNIETPIVKISEPITLNGSDNIHRLLDPDYTVRVGPVEANVVVGANNSVTLSPKPGQQFPQGHRDIVVERTDPNAGGTYNLRTVFIYKNAVRIIGDLSLEGVTMFPTMGEPGSDVQFTRSSFPTNEGYDIYFIKDLNDPKYTEENRAKNFRMPPAQDGQPRVITVAVPDISSGPYHIVFTNRNSQKNGVDSTYVLPQQFQVIRVSQSAGIESVQPLSASSMTATDVTINSYFFTRHNIPGFTPTGDPEQYPKIERKHDHIEIDYGPGTLNINNQDYTVNIKRTIEVDIGRVLPIVGFDHNQNDPSDPNVFKVKTDVFQLQETKEENVIVRMTTNITGGFNATMRRDVVHSQKFRYTTPSEVPLDIKIFPNVIPIEERGGNHYLAESMKELLITIEGKNFLVTRYIDEKGVEQISYPKVTIGGVTINPNTARLPNEHMPLSFEVLRDGVTVNGTENNEIGNKIEIKLKAGEEGFRVIDKDSRHVYIRNPIRMSKDFSITNWEFKDRVNFRLIDKNEFPIIDDVRPSLVSMEGGEDIVITGSNLKTGARVYIGNTLVTGVNVSGDNKTIRFKAPRGTRPGTTMLMVINPNDGGIATHPFTYTITYTQPKLVNINPKEGTTGTLVTVKGDSFLEKDPTVVVDDISNISEFLMYRLIGTRILLDNHDINQYNKNNQNQIQLTPYTGETLNIENDIFEYNHEVSEIELGNGFDSVLLYDEVENKFYRISRDIRNNYFIEDGLGGRYQISYTNDELIGTRGGKVYEIKFPNNGEIELKNGNTTHLHLKAYTPYLIEEVAVNQSEKYHRITGNRVRYIDSETLTFTVPGLFRAPWTGEGFYNVTVVNPDTKRQTLNKAFYYYASPTTRPVVVDVLPDRGPDKGGNYITLIGPDKNPSDANDSRIGFFKDDNDPNNSTKVFIGGQQVPFRDVILEGERQLKIKVPAYIGNIKDKGTDRVTLPIVLVNPQGGTFYISHENPIYVDRVNESGEVKKAIRGYTYLVPTSNPRFDQRLPLTPKSGPAIGGNIVEIFGSDFRDFEPFTDIDGDGIWRPGMDYDDLDGNGEYTKKAPNYKETSKYNPNYEYLTSVLLPRVYFGDKEAEVVEFSYGYMQVIVPPGRGTVDVYIQNNDGGISNTVKYTYEESNPKIDRVSPNVGSRAGGTVVDIGGSNFEKSNIKIMEETYLTNGLSKTINKELTLVKVGNRTNRNIPRENDVQSIVRAGANRASVSVDGGLEVVYNRGTPNRLTVTIKERGNTYTHEYRGYTEGEVVYINTTDLKTTSGTRYPGEELVRIEVTGNRLLVDGGYAKEVEYISPLLIRANMPYYYTVTTRPIDLFVINPDGERGKSSFNYINPDSKPVITDILKENRPGRLEARQEVGGKEVRVVNVTRKGGNTIVVKGMDFRDGMRVQVANIINIPWRDITPTYKVQGNEITTEIESISFTMPQVPENQINKLFPLIVINKDDGSFTSARTSPHEIYIEFIQGESNPKVTAISPNRGPATGGTEVTIKGEDFRKAMDGFEGESLKVYFGDVEVPLANIDFKNNTTIVVRAPRSSKMGNVPVKVENPDGEVSSPVGTFTYISKPQITATEPLRIFTNDIETEVTIKGTMFMPGAKVIIGGRIIPKASLRNGMTLRGEGIREVDTAGRNIDVAVVDGAEAAAVVVVDSNTIRVRFNENNNLANSHIIVINPDGGISEPWTGFRYDIPIPTKPLVLEGIPGQESTVQLIWSDSLPEVLNRADRYEVYGRKLTDKNYTFIGDTKDAQFLVRSLEPNTQYSFMVRAMNRYGSALEFAEVTVRTLNKREDDKLKEKEEKKDQEQKDLDTRGKEDFSGNEVIKTIGVNQITTSLISTPYIIDFSLSKYKDYNRMTVAIPISVVRNLNRDIKITDGNMSFTFSPKDLYTRDVSRVSPNLINDSHVRVTVEKLQGQKLESAVSSITRRQRRASDIYELSFQLQAGRNITEISQILKNGTLELTHDSMTYNRANSSKLFIGQYDPSKDEFVSLGKGSSSKTREKGIYMLLSDL